MNKLLYLVICILIIILIITKLECGTPSTEFTETKTDTTFIVIPPRIEFRTDTVPNYIVRNIIKHDTILKDGVKVVITPNNYCDSNLKFTSQSSQVFNTGDTLHASFLYPEKRFEFEFRPTADTITSVLKTKYLEAKQSPFGLMLGIGIVSGMEGIPKLGAFVGMGVRLN